MANSVTTDITRQKLAQARAGDRTLPVITRMAFGSGGTDVSGNPIAPSGSDAGLNNELLRKAVALHSFPIPTTCRYVGILEKTELVGSTINEIALFDADGDMVCKKTFTNKTKDGDMEMIFEIDDQY